ncbi:MAG TPA: serine hydrolase domain-containing protein [Tahibacter sp.]|uniref:serine hydrolase domain-containing protein n=1 Tax=Tahibacter sp. TaxID=2056211 RepID=UPI002BDE713A|nr:serine hydrolase domain-containing protein [Tahibacter sp.]HSX62067.1 serine hydrolase domain-containing protein [Tahibacter sp.]
MAPMHRFAGCGFVFAVAALWPAASRAIDTCGARSADAASATAQHLLDTLIATNGVPGMGASVYRGGELVWTGCAGWRDVAARVPVRRDTVFRLASVSKVVTAVAAARLSERGLLDLDAPVADLLPWLRNDWPALSVRQLAAHTAGLPHYESVDDDRGNRRYVTSRDAVALFSGRTLVSRPGEAYHYSSWGYTLIGAVIEARSGRSFVDYVRGEITSGLNVRADSDGRGPDVSKLYAIGDGVPRELPPHDFSYTWPGGGLAATPEALVRFAARLLSGAIVSRSTRESMLQPAALADGTPVAEDDYRVALGWRVSTDRDGARIAHHAGATGGARSALVVWPDENAAASVLSNASWVSSITTTATVLAAPFRSRPPLPEKACPLETQRYRGLLGAQSIDGESTFRIEDGRCVGALTAASAVERHFASATAWPNRRLTVVALDADGRLDRAALVTPFGLYELRADDAGWSAPLGATSSLRLTFVRASPTAISAPAR